MKCLTDCWAFKIIIFLTDFIVTDDLVVFKKSKEKQPCLKGKLQLEVSRVFEKTFVKYDHEKKLFVAKYFSSLLSLIIYQN